MSQNEITSAQISQSYPSPSTMAMSVGYAPFYSQGPRLSPPPGLHQSRTSARGSSPPVITMADELEERSSSFPPNNRRPTGSPPEQIRLLMGVRENDDSILTDDNVTPRKRSKISRACDKCRRRKVKQSTPILSEVTCTNLCTYNAACPTLTKRSDPLQYDFGVRFRPMLSVSMRRDPLPIQSYPHEERPQ